MDPSALLEQLCSRYGVPAAFGSKLRPLLERAQVVDSDARQRILDLVERSFAEEARRIKEKARRKAENDERDLAVLTAVAAILHEWDPPGWLKNWGKPGTEGGNAS